MYKTLPNIVTFKQKGYISNPESFEVPSKHANRIMPNYPKQFDQDEWFRLKQIQNGQNVEATMQIAAEM